MTLSIIVPAYNLENYISLTLDSLLGIHFSGDYEILVINDGSTDRTPEIITEYCRKNTRIKLISVENGGVSRARNIGLDNAHGKYVTFVDGDDTVEPDFYEKAVWELENGDLDFVQGNYLIVKDGNTYRQQYVAEDIVISDYDEMLRLFLGPNKQIHNAVWGKVYRTDIARKIPFSSDLKVSEDQKYVFDVLCVAKRIKLLNSFCVNYIQRECSAVHRNSIEKDNNRILVLDYFSTKISQPEILLYISKQRIEVLKSMYWYYTKEHNSTADEIRKSIIASYSIQVARLMEINANIFIFILHYARFAIDIYIQKKR